MAWYVTLTRHQLNISCHIIFKQNDHLIIPNQMALNHTFLIWKIYISSLFFLLYFFITIMLRSNTNNNVKIHIFFKIYLFKSATSYEYVYIRTYISIYIYKYLPKRKQVNPRKNYIYIYIYIFCPNKILYIWNSFKIGFFFICYLIFRILNLT